jgi:hypothetical protein
MADLGQWWKLWVSALDDPDLDNLDISDFGRWAKFGAFVKAQGTSGQVILRPPARKLCAMFQVANFEQVLEALLRLPKIIVTSGSVQWPHGHGKPPVCKGVFIRGYNSNNDGVAPWVSLLETRVFKGKSPVCEGESMRGYDSGGGGVVTPRTAGLETSVFSVSPETMLYVSFCNWPKYQGDFSTPRVRKMREMKLSKRRGEERREEEKKLTPSSNGQPVAKSSLRDDFEKIWTAYPLKKGRKPAFAAWCRLKPRPPIEVVLAAIEKAKRSRDWVKDNGEFIPHPTTWLNQERWTDEIRSEKSSESDPYAHFPKL